MIYVPPRRSDGTIETRRERQPWPDKRPFRILSIDGGGICGILPAAALAELERRFLSGVSAAKYFDLIAGTSTGGIIALGLAHGLTATEVLNFYLKRGGIIFPSNKGLHGMLRRARQWHRYAYERAPLEDELREIFGDTPFGEAKIASVSRLLKAVMVSLGYSKHPTIQIIKKTDLSEW